MPDEYMSDRVAFEPFGSLDGVLAGAPFRIFPQGVFYRGDRKLDITSSRLKQFAANHAAGLPRFRVPINLDHKPDAGKVGTVNALDYLPTGPDGPGLYATQYDLTEKGRKAITDDGYDAVSGEAIWTLFDGAQYQDPTTGQKHDNVLAGVALTPTPLFGHNPENGGVALFSAKSDQYRDFTPEQRTAMADSGMALADGSYPIENPADLKNAISAIGRAGNRAQVMAHIKKRAKALGAMDMLPPEWMEADQIQESLNQLGSGVKDIAVRLGKIEQMQAHSRPSGAAEGATIMADNDKDKGTPPPAAEQFTLTAEQFAEFQAAKTKAEALERQVAEQKAQVETFAGQLAAEKRTRRLGEIRGQVEHFTVLPANKADLSKHLMDLEEKDAELFKYFADLLRQVDGAMAQAQILGAQFAHEGAGVNANAESLDALADKILAEKFGGDQAKYAQALSEAGKQRPDLFAEYQTTYAPSPRRK